MSVFTQAFNIPITQERSVQETSTLRILCIAHSDFDLSSHIVSWIQDQEHSLSYCRPFQGEKLPSMEEFDWLMIMGGSQCLLEKERYPFILEEISFVRLAILHKKLVLGFCLGAQIIGESYGQTTERSPHQEIGIFPIAFTMEAKEDPVLKDFPPSLNVAHWHQYMPGLTKEATILATSPGCPRQVIRYSPKTYAFQCHPEVSLQNIQKVISRHEDLPKGPYIQNKEEFLSGDFSSMKSAILLILQRISQVN